MSGTGSWTLWTGPAPISSASRRVRARPEDIPPAARRPPSWHTAFTVAERRGYSGVGLHSKLQPVRVDTSLGVPRFDREGRFMAGHFQTARGRFVVVNGYFPKGSGPDRDNSRVGYKLDFYRTVFTRAQELRRRGPVLVIGDYNTAHRANRPGAPAVECHPQRVPSRGAGRTRPLAGCGLGGWDVLQLSKSGKSAIGRVGLAPSHAATSNKLLMN